MHTAAPASARCAVNDRRLAWLVALLLFLGAAGFEPLTEYGNTLSRYLLVAAIVDHGTLRLDAYETPTVDKSIYGGHSFSNKAPGVPFLGVPVYWALRHWTALRDWTPAPGAQPMAPRARYLVRLATTALPHALTGALLVLLARRWGASRRRAVAVALAYGFGTLAWIHATLFSGHGPAAAFGLLALALALWAEDAVAGGRALLLSAAAGLAAGLGALCDFTAMYTALALTIYVLAGRPGSARSLAFIGGGGLCVLALGAYNTACFGAPWSMSYHHLAENTFAAGAAHGLLGVTLPNPGALFQLLFSPARGLLCLSPILALAIVGLGLAYRARPDLRRIWWLLLWVSAGFMLINAGFYAWHGGWTYGPRYVVPMLPFLALGLVWTPAGRALWRVLFALSVLLILPAVVGLPHTMEDISNPVVELLLPLMREGYLAHTPGEALGLPGLLAPLPWLMLLAGGGLWLWRTAGRADVQDVASAPALVFPRGVRFALWAWCAAVLVLLAVVRSEPYDLPYYKRVLLLKHVARESHRADLAAAEQRERAAAARQIRRLPDNGQE